MKETVRHRCGHEEEHELRPAENIRRAVLAGQRCSVCASTVYVVVAHDPHAERIAEIEVFTHLEGAQKRADRFKAIYGAANVALASRRVYGAEGRIHE